MDTMKVRAFTLVELLIVISLIALLAILVLVGLHPRKQLEKVWDSQRKEHLAHLTRRLEEYYNDNQKYPSGDSICYNPVKNDDGTCSCNICGSAGNAAKTGKYVSGLTCDPEFSHKNYLYQYDCTTDESQWYRLCAALSQDVAPIYADGFLNYNYGVSSGNIAADECRTIAMTPSSNQPSPSPTTVPSVTQFPAPSQTPSVTPTLPPSPSTTPIPTITPTLPPPTPSPTIGLSPIPCAPDPANKFCKSFGMCNNCGLFANCQKLGSCDSPLQLYGDGSCISACHN